TSRAAAAMILKVLVIFVFINVFLDPARANGVLVRTRRYNSGWFEELQKGDLKRECLEEKCSYEEAREVFEHTELTVRNSTVCGSAPCLNGGSCSVHSGSYICSCLPQYSGVNCELEFQDTDKCDLENGGCEHFCEEGRGRTEAELLVSDGYFLDETDGAAKPEEQKENHLRIVGGTECPRGECPWQVRLEFCCHILDPAEPQCSLLLNTELQFLKVVEKHNTEVYEERADNDIALLRLGSPIVFTPFSVPACLPTGSLANRELWLVRLHTVSGWGRRSENGPTSHLLRRLQQSGVALTQNMFCAGYLDGHQDSCKGDSGGPLVTRYKNTTFLLGIVSWGKGCARPGNYGIYTPASPTTWTGSTATPQPQNHPGTTPSL
uniref:Coagulation factor VII n=1 Tax=Amphiprion percula TaxID=161767 RepID=A0A3P8SLC3_AMPPE